MAHDQLVADNGTGLENGYHGGVVQKGSGSGSSKGAHSDGSSEIAKSRNGQNVRRRRRSSNEVTDATDSAWLEGAIKVSSKSNVKAVAGKLAHSLRQGDPPIMLAMGNGCLNIAVKAVATARRYIHDKPDAEDLSVAPTFDLVCQPAFRRTEPGDAGRRRQKPPSLALYLLKRGTVADPPPAEGPMDMSVRGKSDPLQLAGALAAWVREGKAVSLTGIGADAVSNAMRAVCHARLYLEGDKLDILVRPVFVEVPKGDSVMTAVRLNISVESKVIAGDEGAE